MTLKWALFALLQYEVIVKTSPSIAGVTYMDDFDFEQRFRDVNECNPFHWHPLHMPEMCADMFEKLIRSKIGSRKTLRVMVDREKNPLAQYDTQPWPQHTAQFSVPEVDANDSTDSEDNEYNVYNQYNVENYYRKPLPETDYEKTLKQLMKDIAKDPSHGEIGVVPNIGPAAIYKQEVSKKSEDMITDLATNYAKYLQKIYASYTGYDGASPQLYVWDSRKNKTKKFKRKHRKNKKNFKKNGFRVSRTENNGLVTIIETSRPNRRRRRSALYLF